MTDPATGAPISVAVLGSCITRDSFNTRFNPGYKQWYRTVLMQNQSSLISIMAQPTPITEQEIGDGTEYDRWNVRTDLAKSFLADLADVRPDYLVLDWFGDIHFGVLRLADGSRVTNNRWKLWPTPYYKALPEVVRADTLRIERDTEAYLALWRDAFDRFADHVRRVAPGTTVVVNRGRNTGLLALPGVDAPVSLQANRPLRKLDLPRLDGLWRQLDDDAVASTGWAAIDLTDRDWPTSDVHPWGASYVHYAPDFYSESLAALNELHLARCGDADLPWLATMREHVAAVRAMRTRPLRRWDDEPTRAQVPVPMGTPGGGTPAATRAEGPAKRRPRGTAAARTPVLRRLKRRLKRLTGR